MWLCVHEDRTDRQRQTDKPRIFKLMFPVQNISTVPGTRREVLRAGEREPSHITRLLAEKPSLSGHTGSCGGEHTGAIEFAAAESALPCLSQCRRHFICNKTDAGTLWPVLCLMQSSLIMIGVIMY